jgi:membrane-bound ClpP family serine protease
MDFKRGAAIALIGILMLNLVLLAMGKISELYFWLVLAIIGVATIFYKKKYIS